MPNLINIIEKKLFSKGINKNQIVNINKIKTYFFDEDYKNFKYLKKLNLTIKDYPILFYPGSGSDILTPLKYLESLFSNISNVKLIFMDKKNNLGLIKTILDDVGVYFSCDNNSLKFYWNHLLINLEFHQKDAFISNIPRFDIYFEKAFRIIRDQDQGYEKRIFNNLNTKGVLISDSGFENFPLKKMNVPLELSAYREMVVGVKH